MHVSSKVQDLLKRGAVIYHPSSVYIDSSVDLNRISADITIHPGCRITGKTTSIGPRSVIGEEGPVTIIDCQLAENVTLKGGSFSGAVILAGVIFGPCAHVRPATLLEEQASCAHAVGLKQTILLPYVTLGSQINFCDCLMAGGTSRKNHSEVGSSYIHFNYTPRQDKATASLIGDIPRGVMLDQEPIFLGGQGGLVGPRRIAYGTIVAAGLICRKDILATGKLVFGSPIRATCEIDYESFMNEDISRILESNFIYIGNLHALYHWYKYVRGLFAAKNQFDFTCHEGALLALTAMVTERIKRLTEMAHNLSHSLGIVRQKYGRKLPDQPYGLYRRFSKQWPKLALKLECKTNSELAIKQRKQFLKLIANKTASSYLDTIKDLPVETKNTGTLWLQSVVDSITAMCIS
ncbi:MAG: hypothetical protein PHR77_15470 [Kiritimatiellae bacterium]|nr:hypothetical protein [Kiritimatiellia bacterium]MDD5521291.1 hypothetical protein [Kiritimatiellia bacterium]